MLAAAAALTTLAIVAQDRVALRNAPRDSAPQQAVLWQGDALEVRGERLGYLQVWDHRRERAGWVQASLVRSTSLKPEEAPDLLAVMRFLRDPPGAEALGIAYVAAYLRAAPSQAIGAEPFDALGTMAERLARRASTRQGSEAVSAHLEVATQYGVSFKSYDHDGTLQLCYDGEAFRRVLALATDAHQRARAALALTRADCIDPAMAPLARQQLDARRAEVLDRIDGPALATLSEPEKNRLHMRRAGVWSAIAFQRARKGEATQEAAQRAIDALAAVNKVELSDSDALDYNDAAMRVGASRWAVEAATMPSANKLRIATEAGEPGQTCVLLLDTTRDNTTPLARRCTWGVVWAASTSVSPGGKAVSVAVQPLESWRELWLFRLGTNGWSIDVLPPTSSNPELGYVEFAGWVPGANKLLVAREAREDARPRRSFEVMSLDTLSVEKQASSPSLLVLFGKWQDLAWKKKTVSLR